MESCAKGLTGKSATVAAIISLAGCAGDGPNGLDEAAQTCIETGSSYSSGSVLVVDDVFGANNDNGQECYAINVHAVGEGEDGSMDVTCVFDETDADNLQLVAPGSFYCLEGGSVVSGQNEVHARCYEVVNGDTCIAQMDLESEDGSERGDELVIYGDDGGKKYGIQ